MLEDLGDDDIALGPHLEEKRKKKKTCMLVHSTTKDKVVEKCRYSRYGSHIE